MTHRRPALPGTAAAALALLLGVSGCEVGPKAIRYGQDECAECKMTLVDQHFGAELITTRGKVFKFDDLNCLLTYQRRPTDRPAAVAQLVVVDFNLPHAFLPVAQAYFLQHDKLHTPMGSGLAAFSHETQLEAARCELGAGGRVLRWPAVMAMP